MDLDLLLACTFLSLMIKEAEFYHSLPENTVQCDLCYHFCRIRDGRPGFCRIRINRGGKLITLNYGHPVSISKDPVEKKPLYHFLPGSSTLSVGTLGCNFRCGNCQNWEISQRSGENVKLPFRSPDSIVQKALDTGCRSISFTYNEPTTFAEYALDIMKPARIAGLKNIWVSNGYMSDICLDAVQPLLDAINIDLKSMDESFYRRICSTLQHPVTSNLKSLARSNVHIEVTTLLIPEFSGSPEMLRRLAGFIAGELGTQTPWHISAFVPEISWKMTDSDATSAEAIERAFEIGRKAGLTYVYDTMKHQDTICPQCRTLVIQRIGHTTLRLDNNGNCPGCGRTIIVHY